MKLNPLSWFSDWAEKLGIPVYVLYIAAAIAGVLLFNLLCGQGCQRPY